MNVTFDDSPPSGTPGIVFGFVGGDSARATATIVRRRAARAVLDQLRDLLRRPRPRSPREFFETSWASEQWTRGCPVGDRRAGRAGRLRPALRAPVGRIHWAGTETSTFWNGYMDGAVRSGERAAAEVLAEL